MRAIQAKTKLVSTTVQTMADFGFDEELLNTCKHAIVTAVGENAMILWTGDDPSATFGHPVIASNIVPIVVKSTKSVNQIRVIRQSADSNVTITLER